MRISRLVTGIVLLLATVAAMQLRGNAVQDPPKTIGRIVGADARLNQIVAPGTPFEVIGVGLRLVRRAAVGAARRRLPALLRHSAATRS